MLVHLIGSLGKQIPIFSLSVFIALLLHSVQTAETLGKFAHQKKEGRSVVFTDESGGRLRITPYGNDIIRVQAVRADEDFFPDDRYEMVESHQWDGSLVSIERKNYLQISTQNIFVQITKNPLRISFFSKGSKKSFLQEQEGTRWEENIICTSFKFDPKEHFTGLGHGYYGREQKIDLKGEIVQRNYGTKHEQQAPLIVPFYLSSNGYGVFVNSTFPNNFNFGKDGVYEFSISDGGRMDYFVIFGPEFAKIIDLYTQLTGKPRLPPLAAFGLALSDKGHDHTSPTPSDEYWWKEKILQHRNAGFPLDHIVNDNRWRAGGGKRCESYFEWDTVRYPNPNEYAEWIQSNGLFLTIDFNRCIASHSEGWQQSFNIPQADSIDFNDSAPDLTKKEVRNWFWNLFWKKSLNPSLKYPGDAMWIDEFDEMGKAPLLMVLGSVKTWKEMKNYWFFLIAKALVQEGWDKSFISPRRDFALKDSNGTKRPFVWVRGMTAGAQRYATLWSGDISPTYDDMKMQVRAMQLAGISGFPYWGHDAGGFYDWQRNKGPDDAMYRQWSMAFGSFSPIWKPHGMGESRWPLDRTVEVQRDAKVYCTLRYELMPYTYTYAHSAAATGIPIARAMVIDYQIDARAWEYDLQYMWGNEILVAPNCTENGKVNVWLPKGTWYDFRDDAKLNGDCILSYPSPTGKLPLFVKAGAIIPMANFALSTAFISKDSLTIHVYTGKDGSFTLYEDDEVSEAYRMKNEQRTTVITFNQKSFSLEIAAALGNFKEASQQRAYRIDFHGLSQPKCFEANGVRLKMLQSESDAAAKEGIVWNSERKILSVFLISLPVSEKCVIRSVGDRSWDEVRSLYE